MFDQSRPKLVRDVVILSFLFDSVFAHGSHGFVTEGLFCLCCYTVRAKFDEFGRIEQRTRGTVEDIIYLINSSLNTNIKTLLYSMALC